MDIIIRKAHPGDEIGVAKFIRESFKNKFFKYTGSNTPPSKEKLKKMRNSYTDKKANTYCIVAEDSTTKKIVGAAHFSGHNTGRTRHRVDLGWFVHYAYAGRGIGTMMLKALIAEAKRRGVRRIFAEVAIKNIASLKLAEKCGLKTEGKIKEGLILDDGTYADTYILGKILR